MTQKPEQSSPVQTGAAYVPTAVYFTDSDCVEYVREDSFCVYDRIDGFLTLIYDETKLSVVGFKLKGFKYVFEKHLKPLFELHDKQFVDLVSVIEAVFTQIGNEIFHTADEEKARAYKAALKIAANDNVKLWGGYIKRAA